MLILYRKCFKMDHRCHTTLLAMFFHITLAFFCLPKAQNRCILENTFTPLLVLLTSKHLYCSPEQLVKNTNCGEKLIGLRTYGTRNLSISAFYQWMVPDGTYTTSLFVPGCRNMLLDIKSCFALLSLQVLGSSKRFQIQIEQKARSVGNPNHSEKIIRTQIVHQYSCHRVNYDPSRMQFFDLLMNTRLSNPKAYGQFQICHYRTIC